MSHGIFYIFFYFSSNIFLILILFELVSVLVVNATFFILIYFNL